ncbi:transcriptional repressor LexA [Jeotgalibaca sp. A127]|uniref:transcriptional repressor LexA n=1 Tax=Jeotgalibaca sp. A127 TaxID=3457324 RepID=UPI003FD2AF8A
MKLNLEQRRIIELEPNGHSLIKGVAGSGKTTVAIHRLTFLQQHYCPEEADSILLVTYNKTLLQFIKYQYEQLENAEDESISNLFTANSEIAIKNIDKLMFSYFEKYQKRHKCRYEIADNNIQRKTLQNAILQLKDQYENVRLLSPKFSNFLLDEIGWILSCDIPDVETYQEIDRTGRSSGGQGNNPQKLNKNSDIREAIFALKDLYQQMILDKKFVDFKIMNKLALEEATYLDHPTYTHIIIDESQDLSLVQIKFLKLLHSDKTYASIMFVADNTQSIYSHSWLGKGRPYTTIGYDMSGKSRSLSKNYRTTTEISKAAYSLIEHDESILGNIDFVKPALIDRHGHAPIYRFFLNDKNQADYLIKEIKSLNSDYPFRDICIVAKEKRLVESAATSLEKAGIPCELLTESQPNFYQDKVKLTTMHSIKGLEFKVIFLINLDEGVIPNERYRMDDDDSYDSEERKLLYVGMTRANELLYMSSVRRPSKFIKDLNLKSLRMMKDSAFHPFESIPIPEYKLTNEILDINSKEEVIRQWLIRELNLTFGYPLELISIEFSVQQFSKKGYVDVVVSINHNGEKIPYVFAELKAFGQSLDEAKIQLQSYMEAEPRVRYGIVTNGLEVLLFDRSGQTISDVPPCQPQFLPTNKYEQSYIDFRHNRKYRYLQDKKDTSNIEIMDLDSYLTLEQTPSVQVPIVGNVAAGIPTTIVPEAGESLLLMENWLMSPQNTFALRVTGDSMIGAGIEKGDLVIINKQETANNGDIVIVLIEEEATMKKFMLMGSSVLLISENDNYEPIMMNPNDVRINGKVIGVLKK